MEIDFALVNEVEGFDEDYQQIYLEIIKETVNQLEIDEDLELTVFLINLSYLILTQLIYHHLLLNHR